MSAFVRPEMPADVPAREALLDRVFGAARFAKTCQRLRDGRLPAAGLSFVGEEDGAVVGTVRLWHVAADRAMLMLGPLAVAPGAQGRGLGSALMQAALAEAAARGHQAVVLVGDAPYYGRFGFDAAPARRLTLPGPVERARFLGHELVQGALAGAHGRLRPTGAIPLPATVPAPTAPHRRRVA
ncbi:MAG TPA: N-acetyltransferase [Hyphomicrobiales bacterium]|nr:N-acetyltransferase [Hyphomicrobiales bacterium]